MVVSVSRSGYFRLRSIHASPSKSRPAVGNSRDDPCAMPRFIELITRKHLVLREISIANRIKSNSADGCEAIANEAARHFVFRKKRKRLALLLKEYIRLGNGTRALAKDKVAAPEFRLKSQPVGQPLFVGNFFEF